MKPFIVFFVAALLAAPAARASTAADYGGCAGTVPENVIDADPANYRTLLASLQPGDLLRLAPGTYGQGLPFDAHHGEPGRCIVVEGPASGPPAVLTGRDCCNTVSLTESSYLVIRNLELDGMGRDGDGVKAESTSDFVHSVTLENLYVHGHGVGHWPLAGPGAEDDYLIYGNFFHQNPNEALFQGEGNVIFYANLLVNDFGAAVHVQPHEDQPRRVRIFHNTIVADGTTVAITGGLAGFERRLVGNALFGAAPTGGTQLDNTTDAYAAAGTYLVNPDGVLAGAADRLDLFPLAGLLDGAVDTGGLSVYEDWNVDFNFRTRSVSVRGAYGGSGQNPGWLPALERKSEPSIFVDGFESGNTSAWSSAVP
jgi:hypothetical protein